MWVKFLEPLHRWLTAYMGSVGFILYGGGKGGSSAPAPDPGLINANIRSLDIQNQAIQRVMAISDTMQPLQEQELRFGLDTQKKAYDQSQEDRKWMLSRRGMLAGMQDQQVEDANDFNLEDRQNQMAAEANADVNSAFSAARDQQARGLARMGINPASGRALAGGNQLAVAQAAASANAANKVRQAARAEGYALTDRAQNSLAGYPAMGMTATGAGAGYGAAGVGLANAGLAGMNSGFSTAGGMAGQMGSNATGMYNAQASYKNAQDQAASSNDPFKTLMGAAAGGAGAWGMKKLLG